MSQNIKLKSLCVLTLCMLFYCLDYYFRISPSLIIPVLMQQYHITALGIGAFASAFYLGYLLLQIPIGYILDYYPLNRILILSISTCVVTFILFLFCQQFWLGYFLRFIIGAASAFSFISVLYIAQHYFPPRFFNLITGITIAIGTVLAAVADIVSSALTETFGWQNIMIAFALLGVIIMGLFFLPITRLSKTSAPMKSGMKNSLAGIKKLSMNPAFLLNGIIGGLMYAPTSIIAAVWGIFFMRTHYHFNQLEASHGILYLFIGWAIGSPIMGYLGDTLRCSVRLLIAGAIIAGIASCFYLYSSSAAPIQIYLLLLIIGLSSSSQVVIWKLFSRLCSINLSGIGIALTNMIVTLISAILHFIVGVLLSNMDQYQNPDALLFEHALWLIPTSFVVAIILSMFMLKKLKTNQSCIG